MKVVVILGTRPELIKLSCVIKKIKQNFELILVHTGQNFDANLDKIFYADLDLPEPDYYLDCNEGNLGENLGKVISSSYNLLSELKPDAVLILGDTNSAMSAYSAKRLQIPIFHMEAGNRCFDQRVPEEINRKIVDHLSDINLPYTQIAKSYLRDEGINAESIVVTGSPMLEVLNSQQEKISRSKILERLDLNPRGYILLSTHRSENVDDVSNLYLTIKKLTKLAELHNLPIVFPCHPRTRSKLKLAFEPGSIKNLQLIEPINFSDYIRLQIHAKIVLSDSGTISEEANLLGFNAMNIRFTHERPEVFEQGNIIFGLPTDPHFEELFTFGLNRDMSNFRLSNDYDVENVSEKVVSILASYTNYVNRYTWRNIRNVE